MTRLPALIKNVTKIQYAAIDRRCEARLRSQDRSTLGIRVYEAADQNQKKFLNSTKWEVKPNPFTYFVELECFCHIDDLVIYFQRLTDHEETLARLLFLEVTVR